VKLREGRSCLCRAPHIYARSGQVFRYGPFAAVTLNETSLLAPTRFSQTVTASINTSAFSHLCDRAFPIWEQRTHAGRNVTIPARQYSVNGERRSFLS